MEVVGDWRREASRIFSFESAPSALGTSCDILLIPRKVVFFRAHGGFLYGEIPHFQDFDPSQRWRWVTMALAVVSLARLAPGSGVLLLSTDRYL